MRVIIEKPEITTFDGIKFDKIDWGTESVWAIVEWSSQSQSGRLSYNVKDAQYRLDNVKQDNLIKAAKNAEKSTQQVFSKLAVAFHSILTA